MKSFYVRIEHPAGNYTDIKVFAESSHEVPKRFAIQYPYYKDNSWRGLVVFVDGSKPAEEK